MCARIPYEVAGGLPNREQPKVSHYSADGSVIAEKEWIGDENTNLKVADALNSTCDSVTERFRDRYQWNSREADSDTELTYNRARCYDPTTGRWLSRDPLGFDAGDENLYRYPNAKPAQENLPRE